jgi:hypothetical protein
MADKVMRIVESGYQRFSYRRIHEVASETLCNAFAREDSGRTGRQAPSAVPERSSQREQLWILTDDTCNTRRRKRRRKRIARLN